MKRTAALLLAAFGGTALALGPASSAAAHAALTATDPEPGAVLAEAPASVSATFSENLDGPSTEIAVTDPAGEVVDVPDPTFEGATFTQPMLYTAPGAYTVAFRVISEDGHRVDDALSFTVESIPEDLYAAGSAPADATDAATSAAPSTGAAAESRATGGADTEESNTGATLAAILLGLLVVVVGGVVLVKALGRKQPHEDAQDGGRT